jgi:hypothetical protein
LADKTQGDDLFRLVLQVKSSFRAVLRAPTVREEDACLCEMKRAAYELYRAIGKACAAGETVVLTSYRGGGRRHEIRTLGPLNPDGITISYSSDANARVCLSMCVLPAAQWIEILIPP